MHNTFSRLRFPSIWAKYWAASGQKCGLLNCSDSKSLWRRLWARRHGIRFDGVPYCHSQCLETAFRQELSRLQNYVPAVPPPNRMPLGLLMVARGKITYDQVLIALSAQQTSGGGNIGEWLEKLGFLTEQEVAGALALQWGCPVSYSLESNGSPHKVPLAILEAFLMWPLHYVNATNTQYIAFGRRLDHAALYAIEKMLGCRVQPCVAAGKAIASRIEDLRREPRTGDVEFCSLRDSAEIVRIATSYIARLNAEEIRMCRVGEFIWVLLKNHQTTTNLLFRLQDGETCPAREGTGLSSAGVVDRIPANEKYPLQHDGFNASEARSHRPPLTTCA